MKMKMNNEQNNSREEDMNAYREEGRDVCRDDDIRYHRETIEAANRWSCFLYEEQKKVNDESDEYDCGMLEAIDRYAGPTFLSGAKWMHERLEDEGRTWVSPAIRYPEFGKTVLVYRADGTMDIGRLDSDKGWIRPGRTEGDALAYKGDGRVLYWRELPDGPEIEGFSD